MTKKQTIAIAFIVLTVIFACGCISLELTSSDQVSNDSQPALDSNNIKDASSEEIHPESTMPAKDLSTMTVHFIDVGQGDSILIKINEKNMLIDAGDRSEGDRVVSYLRDNNVEKLDVIVATHAHADHIGGMVDVLNNFDVKRFIDSGNPHTSKTYENMLITIDEKNIPFSLAEAGQTIDLDPSATITVFNPAELTGDLNDDSVVLKLTYGDVSFMFTGDVEEHAESEMIAAEYDIDSDILKVAHHGSSSSTSTEFLEQVNPDICIIMVGTDNVYGHPHQEIVDRLSLFGCQVYRTDLDGTIVVQTDGREYNVKTLHEES